MNKSLYILKPQRTAPATAPPARRRGFSVLELIVTLIIVAIVCATVMKILHSTTDRAGAMNRQMSRLSGLEFSLDQFMNDIMNSAQSGYKITVENDTFGDMATSHVKIAPAAAAGGPDASGDSGRTSQIEWIAAPRFYQQDLVLFRREITPRSKNEMYVPMCENLFAFQVDLLNADGTTYEDPNSDPTLIRMQASLFRSDQPDPMQLLTVNRTFCLKRFPFE